MTISHPKEITVIFPNLSKDFSPFEYITHEAVPTQTMDGISYDTALFSIRTFDLRDIQRLKLPFYYVQGKDTITEFTELDSVQLNHRYLQGSPTQPYRAIEDPIEMTDPPNYPLISLLGIAGIVFLVGLIYIMREPVLKRLRLRKNRKQFEETLFKLKSISILSDISSQLETLNQLWKGYLDPYQEYQLKSLTTTELKEGIQQLSHLSMDQHEQLVEVSKLYDKAIYASGNVPKEEVNELLIQLLPVFEAEYERRKDLITQEK